MAVPADWKFLYDDNDDDDICKKFIKQQEKYLKHANLAVSGKGSLYCEDETTKLFTFVARHGKEVNPLVLY